VTVVLAAAVLSGCGADNNAAVTRITAAADANVSTPAGQTVPARPGLILHAGDEVRTGTDGAVVLATGGRMSYLGGQGSYVVGDGGDGLLRRGAFVVDGRKGPALRVDAGVVTARIGRSAVRIERGFTVRVGVLEGRAITVTGDSADGVANMMLPVLYQVVVAGRGLTDPTPLALTDDDAERIVAPDLVGDDLALTRTATALDSGPEGRAIVTAVAADGLTRLHSPTHVSETALPMAMARAVTTNRTAFQEQYRKASAYRTAGGSWGVVARLVGTDATATGRAIDALLAGVPAAATVLAVAPVGPAGPAVRGGSPRSPGSGNPSPSPGDSSSQLPGGGGSPPPVSPSPSPGPVQAVVNGLIGVLPPVLPGSSRQPCQSLLGLNGC
jgi:hypothetical protein